jgi:hypothetical protein
MLIYKKAATNPACILTVDQRRALDEAHTIKIDYFIRDFITRYKCRDFQQAPVTTNNFWVSGSLIYIRRGRYDVFTIGFDQINELSIID